MIENGERYGLEWYCKIMTSLTSSQVVGSQKLTLGSLLGDSLVYSDLVRGLSCTQ